jgi:hypothetical protein
VFALQNPQPLIVTLHRDPAESTSLGDVVLGALGVTGVMAVGALVLGVVVGFGLVLWRRKHAAEPDHMPPVSPQTPVSPSRPSSPTR